MVGYECSYSQRSCSQPVPNNNNSNSYGKNIIWLSNSISPTLSSSAPPFLNLVDLLTIEKKCGHSYMPTQTQKLCKYPAKDVCDSSRLGLEEHNPGSSNVTAEIESGLSFSPLSCLSTNPPTPIICINEQEVSNASIKCVSVDSDLNTNEQKTFDTKSQVDHSSLIVIRSTEEIRVETENSKRLVHVNVLDLEQDEKHLKGPNESTDEIFNQLKISMQQFPSVEVDVEGEKSKRRDKISLQELSPLNSSDSLFESSIVNNSMLELEGKHPNNVDFIPCNLCCDKIGSEYEQEKEEEESFNEENICNDLPIDIQKNVITSEKELCASNVSSSLNEGFPNCASSPTNSETDVKHVECCLLDEVTDDVNLTISVTVKGCFVSDGVADSLNPTISETVLERDEKHIKNSNESVVESINPSKIPMRQFSSGDEEKSTRSDKFLSEELNPQNSSNSLFESSIVVASSLNENFPNCANLNLVNSETVDECRMSDAVIDSASPTVSKTSECCLSEEISKDSQIKHPLKKGVDSFDTTSDGNKSSRSYSQDLASNVDAPPCPLIANNKTTNLHCTPNVKQPDLDDKSDEEIPCSQLRQQISGYNPDFDANRRGIRLTFSPLYSQVCFQDEQVPNQSSTTNRPSSPTLPVPKVMFFSPLRSLDASFACKIPMHQETDELELSPFCEIKNIALKSANHFLPTSNFDECSTENEHNDEYVENSSGIDGETNKEVNEQSSNLEHFSSSSSQESEHDQNHQDSDHSDDVPTFVVFSPLSNCKMDYKSERKVSDETDVISQENVEDDLHSTANQIVPHCKTLIINFLNPNESISGTEDSENDAVKSCEKEISQESVQEEFLEVEKCHSYSIQDCENVYFTKKIEIDIPTLSETAENQQIQEKKSNVFYVNSHGTDSRGDMAFMQMQHTVSDDDEDVDDDCDDDHDDDEGRHFEGGTDKDPLQYNQHKLNEQVVPENSLMSVHEKNLGESSLYGDHKNMIMKERKAHLLEPYHSSFQWKSVYESVYFENCTRNIQSTTDCLESIVPLPSPMKRARSLRVGLSKRQKVKHLHEK